MTDSYSTVSATLNNPYIAKPIDYGDFRSADPVLNSMLPQQINLGKDNGNANNGKDVFNNDKNLNYALTSPGVVDNAYECSGLDFVNTNPDYDKVPFGECLKKYNKDFRIPESVFNNLVNNLPYTFSSLSDEDKSKYIKLLQNFINKEVSLNSKIISKEKPPYNCKNKKLESTEYLKSGNSGNTGKHGSKESSFNLYILLGIILSILIILIFLLKL